ncbi:hypothetical protein A5634_19560 [Mycobacterium asiaticum]|uniref:Uncharacterized protein n=1 Tax=Mycobacterium asiaticum TaxID=1790 RepID=A0A1A3P6C2_MYCAS|nr:hypothetical protein [Mycobacterium asiaticum]OBK28844.1 hypothetical protein A5634_19560 [Mycobacterium asiaticum]
MIVAHLADSTSGAAMAGAVIGALVLPAVGLTLLILGVRNRARTRRGWVPGYPGYPPAYPPTPGYPPGAPGYAPGGYPPRAPQPPKAGTGLIISGIVLLAVGALGIIGSMAVVVGRSSHLAVGDCFTNDAVDRHWWQPTSCQDPEAVLEYATKVGSDGNCPDGKLVSSSYLSVEHDGVRRCFLPNLIEGHCYTPERNDETVRTVGCGASGKVIRVVKRVDNTTDTSACPSGTHGVSFPKPKRTYCTERTQGIV